MAKFKCTSCNKEHDVTVYSVVIRNDKSVYIDSRSKKELICDCKKKTVLNYVEEEFKGFCTTFGKFSSMTPKEKQASLSKRSKEHFKKNISESKYEKNKALITKFKQD